MKLKCFVLFFLSVSIASCARGLIETAEQAKLGSISIGMVDNSDFKYLDGCGCGFYPSDRPPHIDRADSQKYFLVATGDKGWMNIDGEIVELLRTKDETRYQGKVGEEFKQLYQSDDTAVEVTCKATGFGDTHAVFCDAIITVKKDNQKKVIECAGDCGC